MEAEMDRKKTAPENIFFVALGVLRFLKRKRGFPGGGERSQYFCVVAKKGRQKIFILKPSPLGWVNGVVGYLYVIWCPTYT